MRKIMMIFAFFGLLGMQLFAQKTITGTVTKASDGSTLPGISVVVKGTTIATVTGIDGDYSLNNVPETATTLVFSGMSMKETEKAIAGDVVDCAMEEEAIDVGDVVVTALGISRDDKALGYSVSNVNADETIQKNEPDVLRGLQGKIPGVDIKASGGAPGSATRITIRGNSSFYGNNQPLIVVDGIPYSNNQVTSTNQTLGGGAYGNGLSDIDPNEIVSMSVLKGAAAAALYGSRAANGAILITTKAGSAKGNLNKKLEVNFTTAVAWEQIASLPDYQNTYGNGSSFEYANANGSWGPRFDSRDSIPVWPDYKKAFPKLFSDSVAFVAQPDNVKSLFQTGMSLENSINLRGGNETSAFSVTASNLTQEGYIPHSGFDRTNLAVGGSSKLSNGITVQGNMMYSRTKQEGSLFGNNQTTGASSSFARTLWLGRTWDMTLPYTHPITGGPVSTSTSQYDHPLWAFENNTSTTTTDRISGSASLGYDITPWLSAKYQAGVNSYTLKRTEIVDLNSRGKEGKGQIISDYYYNQEIESNLLLTAKKTFGDFNLIAVFGNNINQRYSVRDAFVGKEIIVRGIDNLSNTVEQTAGANYYNKRRLLALFTDISLGYRSFLFLNFTGRNDWSSTLPKDNRSYFYPQASLSFLFSELIDAKKVLSLGKIRASWAKVGNDAGPYSTARVYPLGSPFNGQPTQGRETTISDQNLSPEFTTEIEAGLQLGLFMNRVTLDFTWYDRKTTDQIASISLPTASGYASFYTNFGEVQNTGYEVGLGFTPVKAKNSFTWDVFTTFTKNKNTVNKLDDNKELDRVMLNNIFDGIKLVLEPGEPYGALYGSYYLRDDDGSFLINPADGLPLMASDNKILGDPNPDFNLGLTNTFSFKGFSLKVVFDWKQGGDLYSNSIASMLGRGVTTDTEDREGSFLIKGYLANPNTGKAILDANGNKVPNNVQISCNDLYFSSGGSSGSFGINAQSEYMIYDATVYRLREVAIGYNIPKKLLDKTPFGNIFISLNGRNLWYLAPNVPEGTNFDPEINTYGATNSQGIEFSAPPSVRRAGFTVRFTF